MVQELFFYYYFSSFVDVTVNLIIFGSWQKLYPTYIKNIFYQNYHLIDHKIIRIIGNNKEMIIDESLAFLQSTLYDISFGKHNLHETRTSGTLFNSWKIRELAAVT